MVESSADSVTKSAQKGMESLEASRKALADINGVQLFAKMIKKSEDAAQAAI